MVERDPVARDGGQLLIVEAPDRDCTVPDLRVGIPAPIALPRRTAKAAVSLALALREQLGAELFVARWPELAGGEVQHRALALIEAGHAVVERGGPLFAINGGKSSRAAIDPNDSRPVAVGPPGHAAVPTRLVGSGRHARLRLYPAPPASLRQPASPVQGRFLRFRVAVGPGGVALRRQHPLGDAGVGCQVDALPGPGASGSNYPCGRSRDPRLPGHDHRGPPEGDIGSTAPRRIARHRSTRRPGTFQAVK